MRRFVLRHRRRLVFAALAVVLFFGLGEIVMRGGGWAELPAERLFSDVFDIHYTMRPGAANPWTETLEFLNAAGFRGPEVPQQRQPGTARILCLGDSTTFGMGVEYEQTYTVRLAEALTRRGVPVEVINAGMPGATLWKQVVMYDAHLWRWQPDLLVLYTNYGYREDYLALRRRMESRPALWTVRSALARLHSYRWLRNRYFPPVHDESDENQYGPIRFIAQDPDAELTRQVRHYTVRDLETLRDRCAAQGAKLLVLPLLAREPLEYAKAQGWSPGSREFAQWQRGHNGATLVGDVARGLELDVLDPADAFLASYHAVGVPLFWDLVHFNAAGHALMADVLTDEICRRTLLPAACTPVSPN